MEVEARHAIEEVIEGMDRRGYASILSAVTESSAPTLREQFRHAISLQSVVGVPARAIQEQLMRAKNATPNDVLAHVRGALEGSTRQFKSVEIAHIGVEPDGTGFAIIREYIPDGGSDYFIYRVLPLSNVEGEWKIRLDPGLARDFMRLFVLYQGSFWIQ